MADIDQFVFNPRNPCVGIKILLERAGGDIDIVIREMIKPPCHISAFGQLGVAFGACLGMTPEEFVIAAKRVRHGKSAKR